MIKLKPKSWLLPGVGMVLSFFIAHSSLADGWIIFDPPPDRHSPEAAFDLRSLNPSRAGDEGFVIAKGSSLAFADSGHEVIFWGVNIDLDSPSQEAARSLARSLAKRGVNLARLHT